MPKVVSLLFVFGAAGYCRPGRIDICSSRHVRRVFSGLGESGHLDALNVTHSSVGRLQSCQAEIVTCPSCVVSLTFTRINLSCPCGSGLSVFLHNPCRSEYVRVTEPPYDDAGVTFCGLHPDSSGPRRRLEYRSKTRTVRVSLSYSRSHVLAFTMEYKTEPNRQLFVGTNLSSGFISSPFFPAPYPRDLAVEYLLICRTQPTPSSPDAPPQDDLNCRIHLTFTDFQLAAPSFVEFYEGSRRVYSVSGTSFRLPIIISSTNSLTARFFASGHNSIGFKAVFSFLSVNVVKNMRTPATDCGGFVGNFGGTITMMNMVDSHMKLYYCIWLIRPDRSFVSVKTHLYLKVTAFLDFAADAELQIRQGLTSDAPLLESLRHAAPHSFRDHVIPIASGCYVSLKASFGPASHFAITYAAFSLNDCFGTPDFLCRNLRCISRKLTCDGSDHCGDNSDESALCRPGPFGRDVSNWHSPTPNYYFPKANQLSAPIVFLLSFLALVFLTLGLTAAYRVATKAQRQRELQDQLRAISDLQDDVSVEDVVVDDLPPSYEPPPSYEEVVKASAEEGGHFAVVSTPECIITTN